MPWRRLRVISSRWRPSGRPLISTTLSSMRVNVRTTSRYSSQSKLASSVNGLAHEARQVDRAEQAGAVGRQRLLAAGVGGADVLAPPVVVHLVDAVDQDEAGLGEVVGGRHDDVPQPPRRQRLVDLAGDQALVVRRRSPPRPAIRARRRRCGSRRSCCAGSYSRCGSGNASFQSRSPRTASMNSSVTSSDRLNWRRRPFSRLARMKSIASGWPTSKVPICAPRRPPAEDTVKHMLVVDIHERHRAGRVRARRPRRRRRAGAASRTRSRCRSPPSA